MSVPLAVMSLSSNLKQEACCVECGKRFSSVAGSFYTNIDGLICDMLFEVILHDRYV